MVWEHWWEQTSHYWSISGGCWVWFVSIIFNFSFCGCCAKPTAPRGLESFRDQTPARITGKSHPTRSDEPIEGGSFWWDLAHVPACEGCSNQFFLRIFLSVEVVQPFRPVATRNLNHSTTFFYIALQLLWSNRYLLIFLVMRWSMPRTAAEFQSCWKRKGLSKNLKKTWDTIPVCTVYGGVSGTREI